MRSIEKLLIEANLEYKKCNYDVAYSLYEEVIEIEKNNNLANNKIKVLDKIIAESRDKYHDYNINEYLFTSLESNIEEYDFKEQVVILENAIDIGDITDTNILGIMYVMLGKTYRNINNFEKSINAYKKALNLNSHNRYALLGYSATLADVDNYELGIKYLIRAKNIKNDNRVENLQKRYGKIFRTWK